MTEIIRFPDGELFLIELLKPRIAPVKVASLVPKQHTQSDKLVRVSRTGGSTKDIVTDGGTYLIECYAASVGDAHDLCAEVRAFALAAARLSDRVRRAVDGGGPAYLPDPDSGQPKYQCLVQLDMRGTATS
mgnify:FL=1